MPQDARLYIDGQLVKTTSSKPAFTTPILANGQSYYYDIRAEVVRDDKVYSENQRIIVRAGEVRNISFPGLEGNITAAAASPSAAH